MLSFEVLFMKDLAAVDANPFGKAEASSQRFVVQSNPILRRAYTILVRGATTPGPKVVEIIGGEGAVIGASDPFVVPPEVANQIVLRLSDVIAPAVGEFTLRMRDVPEFMQRNAEPTQADAADASTPAQPDAADATPAAVEPPPSGDPATPGV